MKLIPVLDLLGGNVVHAREGNRSAYQSVDTPLCRGSHPVDVCGGFMTLFPFSTVYIADLDGIEGKGDNAPYIDQLAASFPDVTFWVDNGIGNEKDCQRWLEENQGVLVLGSESFENIAAMEGVLKAASGRLALSLDFRGDDFLGPSALLKTPALWGDRVIVMSLSKVGGATGPDLEKIQAILEKGEGKKIFAAGGVGGAHDLATLKEAGVAGVLLASALYDGRLCRNDLEKFLST